MTGYAYIGVDGRHYRVLIPPRHIWLSRAEGPTDLCRSWEWTTYTYHPASWQLMMNAKTAPDGGAYDKHDFIVTFLDGTTYRGRYDLHREEFWPCLMEHMRSHVAWLRDNGHREFVGEERAADAGRFLQTYYVGQAPQPAPDDWPVIRDYRERKAEPGELPLLVQDGTYPKESTNAL